MLDKILNNVLIKQKRRFKLCLWYSERGILGKIELAYQHCHMWYGFGFPAALCFNKK